MILPHLPLLHTALNQDDFERCNESSERKSAIETAEDAIPAKVRKRRGAIVSPYSSHAS